MTLNAMPDDHQLGLAPLDEKVDHVRGSPAGHLIIEYGDYECPYSRQAFRAIAISHWISSRMISTRSSRNSPYVG